MNKFQRKEAHDVRRLIDTSEKCRLEQAIFVSTRIMIARFLDKRYNHKEIRKHFFQKKRRLYRKIKRGVIT